jgi:hypothetical protein
MRVFDSWGGPATNVRLVEHGMFGDVSFVVWWNIVDLLTGDAWGRWVRGYGVVGRNDRMEGQSTHREVVPPLVSGA